MKPIKRDNFIFYESYFRSLENQSPECRAKVYEAIFNYVFNCKNIELSGVELSIFTVIKPVIDANNRKYKDGKKGAKYGKLGGRPKNPIPLSDKNPTPLEKNNHQDKEKDKEKEKVLSEEEIREGLAVLEGLR